MSEVRVRFAPSPTGYLHVGGLRTALYNYLFAKHNGGKMIMRLEDTDRTRLVEDAAENLIKSLSWAGIEFDESPTKGGAYGPYIQSERFELYSKYSKELIENGNAYYAFDTAEEIESMRQRQQSAGIAPKYDRSTMRNQFTLGVEETSRLLEENYPHVVRLRVPLTSEIKFSDIIRGEVVVHGRDVDDQILLKSDSFPTYHLANVVDDHLMEITHIIRGEEWLPSTPKHVLLYQAFGWEIPQFAHLPLLLNTSKQKLSKRHGDVAVEDFRNKGYFRDAFVNFVALLGFNPSGEREIYSIEELCEAFDLSKCNKSGAVFDLTKLEWMNAQYLRNYSIGELVEQAKPSIEEKGFTGFSDEYIANVIELIKERIHFINDVANFADYMFLDEIEYETEYIQKRWDANSETIIRDLFEIYKKDEIFNHDSIYAQTKEYIEKIGIKLANVTHPLRIVITGKSVGAGIFETMVSMGKEKSIKRIEAFLRKLSNGDFKEILEK